MSFVWFWTFWHWSTESVREGFLLRSPLQGIGGHWDEWFRHEASESEQRAIGKTGRTEASQRQFVEWLVSHWARDCELRGNPLGQNFVLHQLAQVQPFNQWTAFEKYRNGYGVGGISAVVLTDKSMGETEDVRVVEALALPADPAAPPVVAEGFEAGSFELETPRHAVMSLLGGKGFLIFLTLWVATGKRPYPQWLKAILNFGWVATGGLILWLFLGSEPGPRLFLLCAVLLGLWSGLALLATVMAATIGIQAWQQGRIWQRQLEASQVRLRMDGGLTLCGGSAGLAFCLNTILSLFRADARLSSHSWLWQRLLHQMNARAGEWAATGVITADGYLKPVVLEAKLRACLKRDGITDILTPRQPGAARGVVNRLASALAVPATRGTRLGFAAEAPVLRIHPCRHVAQLFMRLGQLTSGGQMMLNLFAGAVSVVMLLALSDLRGILRPPPAPLAVVPGSPSPDYLWVSLNTKHPEYFLVELESHFWLNRRVEVAAHDGPNGSVRAEIRLERFLTGNRDPQDGAALVLRRQRFLTREFVPGECVGRYDLSYLNNIEDLP